MFHRNKPNDVLFLMPVRLADQKTPRGKVRMLYCDATGKVYSSIMNKSTYELARQSSETIERSHKSYATVGLEIGPGAFVPTSVEISPEELWALEHILEHALNKGRLPDILKKYLKPIIEFDEASREAVIQEYKKRRRQPHPRAIPRVLDRLSYYPENDIKISVPIYKAEYSYPLIALKHLASDDGPPDKLQKLLVLDSDGDLAVISVPPQLIDKIEKVTKEYHQKNGTNKCAIISKNPDGLSIDYIVISQSQSSALDALTRYFEETGDRKQPVSAVVKAVLARARDAFPPAD
jgi:hypothetical protein